MADSSQTAKLEKQREEILRCLVIPAGDINILLPNTVVAEVSVLGELNQIEEDMPEWFSGLFSWRGVDIPLVSFSRMMGHDAESGKRVAVLNTLSGTTANKFIGLSISGIPRLVMVNAQMVDYKDGNIASNNDAILAEMDLGGDHILDPDLPCLRSPVRDLQVVT